MVTVFHAEEGTCVQAQRFEAVTLLRKHKWFHVTEVKVLK